MKLLITFLLFSIFAFAEDTAPIVNLSVAALNEPAQFVKTIESRQGLKIACLEDDAALYITGDHSSVQMGDQWKSIFELHHVHTRK